MLGAASCQSYLLAMIDRRILLLAAAGILYPGAAGAAPTAKVLTVEVEPGVSLEVLDWGGAGPPLVFLSGFGGTAHTFEGFAERFTGKHRVYSVTRRGFGRSSRPDPKDENFTVGRLAADVVAVLQELKLRRPVLVGHSVAGQELSEIGINHPKLVAGLIYLDAANSQAFYGPQSNVLYPIAGEVRHDLRQLVASQPSEARRIIAKLRAELPRLERGLDWYEAAIEDAADRSAATQASPEKAVSDAVVRGARVHGPIGVPILSIAADPPRCEPNCDSPASKAFRAQVAAETIDFEKANPSAVVVRIPRGGHFIWKTNGEEVQRHMNSFLAKLPAG